MALLRRECVTESLGLSNNAYDILCETATDLSGFDWAGTGSLAYCKDEDDGARVYVKTGDGWEVVA